MLDLLEDHTSKCSFLDSESIEHHDKYMGKRIYRGLFEASKGTKINVPKRLSISDLMMKSYHDFGMKC